MKKAQIIVLISSVVAFGWMVAGCSVGEAPAGMSGDDAKTAVSKMSPQDQIKFIQSSPMPPDEKAKKIAEIEAKSGVKAAESGAPKGIGSNQ